MADAKHLSILKEGVTAWNAWRKAKRLKSPVPEGLPKQLRHVVIPREDFCGPDLSKADLHGIDLTKAYLVGVNFRQANLQKARFDYANLRGADMMGADLRKAVFANADVSQADLSMTEMGAANCRGSDLRDSKFWNVDLKRANLQFTDLRGTSFVAVNLTGSTIKNALFLSTLLCDTTLRNVKGLDQCIHEGPSSVDYHTLAKSDQLPVEFLQGCGLSDGFINRLSTVLNESALLRCFVSYSVKDEKFVDRLYTDLQKRGIRCWYFRHNARWGYPLWEGIDQQINTCDRFILVCSKNSLQSVPVLRETERALQREERDRKSLLYPIQLDEYIFKSWKHARKPDIVSKVIGNFCQWRHAGAYAEAFDRFLKTLHEENPTRQTDSTRI